MSLILTIDIGTSGPKVALFDVKGKCLGYEFKEVALYLSDNGGAEQNPAEWIAAIEEAFQILITKTNIDSRNITAINTTTQWSGVIPINKEGIPLHNCINWMDSRGAENIKKLIGGFPEIDGYNIFKILKWVKLTGGGPTKSGKDTLAHILWLKTNMPEVYEKTYKFLEPKDYINFHLTGIIAASYESITMHWVTDNRDIQNVKYHDELLKIAGLEKEKLPHLIPANSLLGNIKNELAKKWNLNENVKVFAGTPDVHSAAVGSGAVKDFEAHLYIGTSSWLVSHVPFKKTDLLHNMATLPSALPGKYLIANEQETTGACLNFIKNNILFYQDELNDRNAPDNFYAIVDKIVEKTPAGSEALLFLPWLYGERSPIDDHHVRGGFYNLSLNHNRSHLLRAVFEGIALNARWLLMYAEKMAGQKFQCINFIGGGANSDIWSQIIADVFNRPVRQVEQPLMANSRGAAMLALLALGKMNLEDISNAVSIKKEYLPQEKHRKLYDERFEIFLKIYKQNKKIFSRLNP